MSLNDAISIFIPCAALNNISNRCFVFGHVSILSYRVLINCTIFLETKSTKKFENILDKTNVGTSTFNFLGVFYIAGKRKDNFESRKSFHQPISFDLRIDRSTNSFYIENMCIKSSELKQGLVSQLILYDNFDLAKSHMFLCKDVSLPEDGITFVQFLSDTLRANFIHSKNLSSFSEVVIFDCAESSPKYYPPKLLFDYICILSFFFEIISKFLSLMPNVPFRLHETCLKVFTLTSVGRQVHQRVLHVLKVIKEIKTNDAISLEVKNLISAIIFDLLIGWLVTFTFLHSNMPLLLFDLSLEQTKNLVSNLQILIHWLMGAPAGLKLNIPLNSALGHFFLYHIYLWEAYMTVVLPLFTFILKISVFIGVLGMTFVLCLLTDLIALATIHIYCFYGYAARLYGYQVMALSSLWRLFRGKKWNPLRQRVDSYTYDIHQLFLGTLIFTVLLFLLPTVMIYYVVFTCLRIMVLAIQRIILKIIQVINVNPLYCTICRLIKSTEVAGDVYFSVLSTNGTLTLSMEVTQVSFQTVIKETLPKLNNTEEYLTWKEFLSSILVGKIIYPL